MLYKTYRAVAPVKTHFRPATCAEVDCQNYVNGWKTVVPSSSDHAQYIRSADFKRSYHYTERAAEGGLSPRQGSRPPDDAPPSHAPRDQAGGDLS